MKYLILSCFFFIQISFAQINQNDINSLPTKSINGHCGVFYGTENDGFPDSVAVTGIIDKVSLGVSCGVMCGSGTVRIRVANKTPDYGKRYMYIVVPCLIGEKKDFIGKKIKITVYKLYKDNSSCYFKNIANAFKVSVPFYFYDIDKFGPFLQR